MKNTRKILIVLLALAISFVCSSVVIFAADTPATSPQSAYEAALAEHKKVLEYYEAGYYLNADFDDATDLNSALSDASDEFSFTKGVAFGLELDAAKGTAHFASINSSYFDFNPNAAVSFGINAKLKIAAGTSFSLSLHSSTRETSGDYLRLFSISEGQISYKLDYEGETPKYLTKESKVKADTYFNLSFVLQKQASQDVVVFTVTPEGGEAETFEYSYDNTTTDFINGKFNFKSFYIAAEDVTFDTLQVYRGTFVRDFDNSKNVNVIANAIKDIKEDYNNYSSKISGRAYELLDIVAALVVTHGYDCDAINDADLKKEVTDFAQSAVNSVTPGYVNAYAEGVAAIDKNAAYYDRINHLETISIYSEFLNKLQSSAFSAVEGINYDAIAANIAKVDEEEALLIKAKNDTIKAVEAAILIPDVYAASYKDYKEVYDTLFAHPICVTYYDDVFSAETVNLAKKVANVILAEYPKLELRAKAFVTNVQIANDSSLDFADKYAAFKIAKENLFKDTSYNEYLEDTTIEQLLADYAAADAMLSGPASYAEEFLSKIDDAVRTSSYSVKTVALAEAKTYIDDVEIGYPGVLEAIKLYEDLMKDISDKIEATKKYIQAVIDVQDAKSIAEKKAAIAVAKNLAIAGSDVSVEIKDSDITVTQANVILSNEESVILLAETAVSNYINAVNALKDITGYPELRRAISSALTLKERADATAAGVSEATAALEAAIASFNAGIEAANSESNEVNNVALSALGATVPTKRVGEVVAILKKFYE